MCKIMEDAIARREKEKVTKIALSLLSDGMSYEKVAKHTGLPLNEVAALAGEKTA